MVKAPTAPTSPPGSGSDPVVAALQHAAALLESDAAASPTAAFRQRARLEILQAIAAPPLAPPRNRLHGAVAQWGSMLDRRRLVGLGLGAALFGLVAVPAFAAPSSAVGRMTGAVGAAIADVPALFAGAPPPASPRPSAADTDTATSTVTTTSTRSSFSSATRAPAAPQGRRVIVPAIARSTAEQDEARGDAVLSAAHSSRVASSSVTSTSSVASAASTDADSHGDAVSAVAHTPPVAGENHGQQVSAAARRATATTTASSVTSAASTPAPTDHGAAVATAAQGPAPAGETHGQQVRSLARGVTSRAVASISTASAALPTASPGGQGNGAGAATSNGQGANGKSHGR